MTDAELAAWWFDTAERYRDVRERITVLRLAEIRAVFVKAVLESPEALVEVRACRVEVDELNTVELPPVRDSTQPGRE